MSMKKTMVSEAGCGIYDLPFSPDYILELNCGRFFLIADLYCGGGVEGYCYRRFFAEITRDQIPDVLRAARGSWPYEDFGIQMRRLSRGPIWLRRAVERAERS